jgi:hypothetical protein
VRGVSIGHGKAKELKQLNPWDTGDLAGKIDTSAEEIYLGVGLALSNWNILEKCLAGLFSVFAVHKKPSHVVVRGYGAVRTFEARLEMLRKISEAYFACCQQTEKMNEIQKTFKNLINTKCTKAGEIRNNIAHGSLKKFETPKTRIEQYWLGPSIVDSSKTQFRGEDKFRYNSSELDHFAELFMKLANEAADLIDALLAQPPPF